MCGAAPSERLVAERGTMPDALERLVNLAMYLASAPAPVDAEAVRANVDGYPKDQEEAAFRRMFERDKDDLRAAGFVIVSRAENTYNLDAAATFASQVELTASEAATIRAVGSAFLGDESFPFSDDLRLALAKLAEDITSDETPALSCLAEEQPSKQGAWVALLDGAISARKRVEFDYVNSAGEGKHHCVEPFGLFVRDGRWYVAGRDCDLDQVRVYTVARMDAIDINATKPKTPDFDRPADFDIRTFIALPFQYGPESFEACIAFDPSQAWRAPALTAGIGATETAADGSLVWCVVARDRDRLMRWIVEHGPGLRLLSPSDLADELGERLRVVADAHA